MEDMWWTPSVDSFISEVGNALKANKNILIVMPEHINLNESFYKRIDSLIKTQSLRKELVVCNVGNTFPSNFFLENFISDDETDICKTSECLADISSIKNSVFLCYDVPEEKLSYWSEFITDYYSEVINRNEDGALFILLTNGISELHSEYFVELEYSKLITDYDIYIYIILLLKYIDADSCLKKYLAELISKLCMGDPELCKLFVESYNGLIDSPIKCVSFILSEYAKKINRSEIKSIVREAQIHSLMPVIEINRQRYIQQYRNEIKIHMPYHMENNLIKNISDINIEALADMAVNWYILTTPKVKKKINALAEAEKLLKNGNILNHQQLTDALL